MLPINTCTVRLYSYCASKNVLEKIQTYKGFWHEAPARGCESATTCKTENNLNVSQNIWEKEGDGWWLRR